MVLGGSSVRVWSCARVLYSFVRVGVCVFARASVCVCVCVFTMYHNNVIGVFHLMKPNKLALTNS